VSDPDNVLIYNDAPIFIGSPPVWASHEPPAPVVLSDVYVVGSRQLSVAELSRRFDCGRSLFSTAMLKPLLARRPDQSTDRMVDTLALAASAASVFRPLRQAVCTPRLLRTIVHGMLSGAVVDGVYTLHVRTPVALALRIAASRLLRVVLDSVSLDTLNEVRPHAAPLLWLWLVLFLPPSLWLLCCHADICRRRRHADRQGPHARTDTVRRRVRRAVRHERVGRCVPHTLVVECPPGQGCCSQRVWNGARAGDARPLARVAGKFTPVSLCVGWP
jgi:hypothetical protein